MNKWVNSIHCFITDWGINYPKAFHE